MACREVGVVVQRFPQRCGLHHVRDQCILSVRDCMSITQMSSGDVSAWNVSQGAEASIADEYLVAHRIPSDAIVGCRDTDDIKKGEYLLSSRRT
jgi:hypothetical protein